MKTLVVASLVPQSQLYRLLAAVLPTSLQTNTVFQQSGKIERWCNKVETRIQLTLKSNQMLKRSTDVCVCVYILYLEVLHSTAPLEFVHYKQYARDGRMTHVEVET